MSIVKHLSVVLLLFLLATVEVAQQHATPDIIARLLPDHDARRVIDLNPAEKAKAVEQLRLIQKRATGERSQEVAFLLAAYDVDYEKNRDYLIHTLRGCTSPSIKFGCNDNTGAFLIALYERGHKELLEPLMLLGKDSYNAALAEGVGAFYSEVLLKHTAEFLSTIRPFPSQTQRRLCELAGTGDGGGMSPADLKRVRKQLGAEREDEVAAKCLRAVEAANKP